MKKFLSILLCIMMLMSLLVACNTPTGNNEETTVGGTNAPVTEGNTTEGGEEGTTEGGGEEEVTTPEVTEPIVLPKPHVYKMTKTQLRSLSIVYPEGSPNEIYEIVDQLQDKFRELYKVNVTDTTDTNYEGETAYEIILGDNTNRDVSFSAIRECGYGYQIVGTKILIAGVNSVSDTVLAAQEFIKNCLAEEAQGLYFYTTDQDKFFNQDVKEYHHDTLMLNGFEIQNFRIVYPAKDDKWESEQAQAIREAIAEDTGWYITMLPDTVQNNGELEILIGKTNRKSNFTLVGDSTSVGGVQVYRNFVNVGGNNAAANVIGGKMMLEAITVASQNQVDEAPVITLKEETKSIFNDDHHVSAMTFNVWVGGFSANPTRKEVAAEQIKQLLPDTVGLQEASVNWYNYFCEVFSDYYTIVGFGRESGDCDFEKGTAGANAGEGTFIMIAKDKYDLVKTQTFWLSSTPTVPESMYPGQQYLRVVTWAELTRKSDGKSFVHCNTHIDFGDNIQKAQITQILNYMKPYVEDDIPVIVTGDFNFNPSSAAYQLFAPAGFVSSEAKAAQIGKGGNTFPNKHPDEYSAPTNKIDFLMTTSNITVSYYTVLTQPVGGLNVSDHYPVYIEFNY